MDKIPIKPKEFYDPSHFRVAIFGSARIQKNDPRYKDIYRLAKMIASQGIDVITGGGPGLMEAANAGHQAGRGTNNVHSYGLNIKLPKEQSANVHLDIKKDFERFSKRLDTFMSLSNAVVVAPGGVGTLLEFFYTWQLVQVEHICNIPIILFGELWEEMLEWLEKWPLRRKLIDRGDLNALFYARTCKDAMKVIKLANTEFKKGDKDFCISHKKYTID